MVNYVGLKKQEKYGIDHWKQYGPTSLDNLLVGTTWFFFHRHFIGMRGILFDVYIKSGFHSQEIAPHSQ